MKTTYLLGAAVALAAAFGYQSHARRSPAISADDVPVANADRDPGLPPGHPTVSSRGELSTSGHPGLASDPGVPEALLDAPNGELPPGHPALARAPEASPATGEAMVPPGHPEMTAGSPPIMVPKLERAPGSNGYSIANLYENKQRLAGTRVRVRGTVVKVTLDVLGSTFLHVRDGTGEGSAKTDDLAVTTSARPSRGDTLVFEGVLRSDVDLGTGYHYPALLENATATKE